MKRNWLLFWVLSFSSISTPLWSVCDPPFLLSVSNITTTSATLNWTPLGHGNGVGGGCRAARQPHAEPAHFAGNSLPSGLVHPGLNPGTDYDFYVRAVCDTVPGIWAKYGSHFVTGLTNPSGCQLGLEGAR